jgi:hypothetical protein
VVLPAEGLVDFQDDQDPGDVVFDEEDRPILQWMRHPAHRGREGWVLFYPEPDGNGVEDHPTSGRLDDVDWALEQAREHLRWRWSAAGRA